MPLHSYMAELRNFEMAFLLRLSHLCDQIVTSFGRLGAWAVLLLIAVTLFDVVTRRFFVLGSTRLQELEWHLHTILMMFVFGYALLKDRHVRVDLFREQFSAHTRAIVEMAGNVFILLPFCIMVLYFSFSFVSSSYEMSEVSASMTGLSHRWIIKSTLLLAFLLVLLAGLSSTIKSIDRLTDRTNPNPSAADQAKNSGHD